jgi:AcrR family transcriptional regulator
MQMSLRQRKKIQQRERILGECGVLFRNRGFDETTIADITEAVGISRQTFFNYFSGKEEVLTELGLAWLRVQAEIPRLDARSSRQHILAGTRAAIRGQLEAVEADAKFMRLVFTRSGLLFPGGGATGPSDRVRADHTRPIFEGIAIVMRAGQASGEIRDDIDPLQAAELYVSLMLMTIRFWLVNYWEDGDSLVERGMKALDVLEDGLRKRNGD